MSSAPDQTDKADKLNAILSKKKTSKRNQFADDVLGTMMRELSSLVRLVLGQNA